MQKNKTTLLLRTTLLMYAEKICKSKAADAEMRLSCAFTLYILAFSVGCVLYLTLDSTHVPPWHFKLKKLTIPIFSVQ